MNLKRVLMLAVFAAAAAFIAPGTAHAQVRIGIGFGGGYRPAYYPYSYYRPGVRVAVGLPPVAIGVGGPVYVAPAPVVYPAPVYYPAPAPVYVAPQPAVVAVPGPPALPPAPVPIR